MNAQIAKLGAGLLACYLALFAMVNYIQLYRADDLRGATFPCFEVRPSQRDPAAAPATCTNSRGFVEDFDRDRGEILSADGSVLARTEAASSGRFEFQRVYPPETAELFAHVTGSFNFAFGADGVERSFDDELSGDDIGDSLSDLGPLLGEGGGVRDVTLTLDARVQAAARDALGEQRGSVVALDPRDGSVLASWSFPSYDPNRLATHDQAAATQARLDLQPDELSSPLVPAAYRRSFFPGSTFKVVTAAIGVQNGVVTPTEPVYPMLTGFDVDFTSDDLGNFGGSSCGGTLNAILAASCNSAFAAMGAETIGQAAMVAGAESFGFNERPGLDLPATAASTFPTSFPEDQGNGPLARASIGQGDVSATPLQMAMVVAAVANDGVLLTPHVLARITDEDGATRREADPEVLDEPLSASAAATVRDAMIGVVERGSGRAARIDGFVVGGKTGTAQLGTDPPSSHAWFVAFAGPPDVPPEVAVAVIVEAQPGISEVTGGRVAAPIARSVMETVLTTR